jgi:hypothetical protein
LVALLDNAGLHPACWVEPLRYDPAVLLPDPKLRARMAALDPVGRAALTESLVGNMAVHIVYCVRSEQPEDRADPFASSSVPITREMTGEMLAQSIQRDGTMTVNFDGLRVPVAVPPLASAILPLIDGKRSVAEIAAEIGKRGTGPEAFDRAWRATYPKLESINRLLLAAPSDD